ncbi:filamentous hemagglutinin N-terminal domain-containing protein [Xanthomonas nasturtii]|uniref:two-partner secretion domain-containing protein n=1 Tax=Xanthomonas TaxID=338 RepID=UPI002B22A466|nr:filamentous hemagglutinin N-terminal domain-containing protein [Xanthomonas nasturtii]MEA9557974.1 filamentous hemagglutinin N-terminal domain-containing protein [Xanthomonas nasturtii]
MHANHTASTVAARPSERLLRRSPLALALAAALMLSAPAMAQVASTQLPTGGSIVGGTGTINAPNGTTQVIDQTGSRMALNWTSFDIGSAATVRFNQPSASSVILNRVIGGNPTQIFGNITANGQVFLLNSNGILFGNTAQVNVGGLVATTLGAQDINFINGNDVFDANGGIARVSNAGTITAAAGAVNLIGAEVLNSGTITANAGNITLAGADKVTLSFESGGFGVVIDKSLEFAQGTFAVNNSGSLIAPGGTISLSARAAQGVFDALVNNSGVVRAAALAGGSDGSVSLVANGAGSNGIVGNGSIDVGSGAISYVSDVAVQQGGVLTAGNVSGSIGGNASFSGANKIANLGFLQVAGNLGLTNTIGLAQQGALTVGGTSTFSLGNQALTLSDGGNHFGGSVGLTSGATQITDSGALTLSTLTTGNLTATSTGTLNLGSGTVTGALSATSNNGAIQQAGNAGLTVTGTSDLQAGTGAISLTTAGNDFQQAVSLRGGTTQISDSGALTLGTLATGNLTATSSGALNLGNGAVTGALSATSNGGQISQTGALTVNGTSTLDSGNGGTALSDSGNDFVGALTLTGNGIAVRDANALTIVGLTNGSNGAITLTAGGALNLPAQAIATGTGALSLSALGGGLSTGGALSGNQVSLRARDALNLGHSVQAGGNLQLTSDTGAITQTAGLLAVTGTTNATAAAGTGAISLGGAGNDFGGAVSLTGSTAVVNDSNALTLGAIATNTLIATSHGSLNLGQGSIGGFVTATSNGGAITQNGALTLTGPATLNAGSGAISLGNGGNDFQGALTLVGTGIAVSDLDTLSVTSLTAGSGGDVTLTAGADLLLPAQAIDLGAGNLRLSAQGSTLATKGALSANQINLSARDGLTLDHDIDATSTLALTTTNAAITQGGGAISAGALGTVNAGTGAISLLGPGNDFTAGLDVTGGAIGIYDRNDLSIVSLVSAANSAVTLTAGGMLSLPAQSIDTGSATLQLRSDNSSLATNGALRGGNVSLNARTGITLSHDITSSGNLQLRTTNAALTQLAGRLAIDGTTTVNTGSGAVALNGASNAFTGALSVTGGAVQINALSALTLGSFTANALTVSSGSALDLGQGSVATSLTATSASGGITQTGGLEVGGAAQFTAGTDNITLTTSDNDFRGVVGLSGNAVQVVDRDRLTLGNSSVGSLLVDSSNTDIDQQGALTVSGSSRFDAGSGSITLTDSANNFAGAVNLAGGAVQVVDANTLTLGTLNTGVLTVSSTGALNLGTGSTGALTATSNNGAITQTGALSVNGVGSINAGSGTIALTDIGNDFSNTVNLTGGAAQIVDANALTLGSLNTGALTATSNGALNLGQGSVNGALTATSNNGAITQAGALTVTGASTINAGSGAIALTDANNDFQGAVSLTGNGIAVTDRSVLNVSSINGNSNGDIALTAQTLNLPASAISAGSGNLTLTSTGSAFSTGGALSGSNVVLTARDGLTLAHTISAGNALTLRTTNAAINQTGGQLLVGGITTVNAGSGAIVLTNANDFIGAVALAGGAAQIVDANALSLGSLNTGALTATSNGALNLGTGTTGSLTATSNNGAITQAGALTVTGASTINAGSGAIVLTDSNNDFQGAVGLTGNGIAVTDRSVLNVSSINGNSNGDIALTAQTLNLPASAISAGIGSLTLTSTGSAFGTGGALSGGNVVLTARDGLTLAHTISAGNALTLRTTNAAINQSGGQLLVGGLTTVNAGTAAITLNGANDFQGAVNLTGGVVQLNDSDALTLGTLNTGALTVTSNGTLNLGQGSVNGALTAISNGGVITQTNALSITGASTLDAGNGSIALTNANNDFVGAVAATGDGIALVDGNDLQLASVQSTGTGAVTLDAGGALLLPATTIDTGTRALSLIARGGTLTTVGALRGGDVQLTGADGIVLGNTIAASGDLAVRSTNAAITQRAGTLQVAGNSVVDAGSGAIVLDAAGNDFQGLLALSGGATRVRAATALTLGALNTGALDVASTGALNLGFGLVNGDLDAASNGGGLSQTAALTVTGVTRIDSAGASIALADAGNDFQSAVNLRGGDTRVRDRNALTLGNVDVAALEASSGEALNLGQGRIGGTLVARSGVAPAARILAQALPTPAATDAGITQQGALIVVGNSVLDAGSGAIVLTDAGNDFQGSVQATGGSIALVDRNDLAVAVQASGAVALQAGGQLSTSGAIAGNAVALSSGGGMQLGHDISSAGNLSVRSGGAITQSGGSLRAAQLSGSAAGEATLTSAGNAIGTLGDFRAQSLDLFSAGALQVSGRVDGGNLLRLRSGDALLLDGQLSAATTWLQAVAGIRQRAGSTLSTNLLSGSAGGPVVLGDATTFIDNRVVRLGDFTASNGFSLTNAGDLTLVLANGSSYSVDAGNSALLLSVRGDLLQEGRATLRDGTGNFSATGRIGTQQDPIYLIGTGAQVIGAVGAPPAYFNATTAEGGLLELSGGSSFNVPASAFAGRAQSSASRTIAFVDLSASGTPYRAFGLVRPGLRLPDDQQPACDAGDPDAVCTPQ